MQSEDDVGAADGPEHAGLFEALADSGLASGFDDAQAHKQVFLWSWG